MPGSRPSPKPVPYGADQTAYLVVDGVSASGRVYRETEVERADFETIIADFLTGQFSDPIRVFASTHSSIGRMTFRRRLPSKSKPDATSKVSPCPSMSATSWTATAALFTNSR